MVRGKDLAKYLSLQRGLTRHSRLRWSHSQPARPNGQLRSVGVGGCYRRGVATATDEIDKTGTSERAAGYEAEFHVGEGQLSEAVEALDIWVQRGCYVPVFFLYQVLKSCIAKKSLVVGRGLHDVALKSGYEANRFLANNLIRMYASHGMLDEASSVFGKLVAPNSFSWSAIILAHAEHEQPMQAVQLYWQMRQSTRLLDNFLFAAVLKACATAADLTAGRLVHADVSMSLIEPDSFVGNSLVDMYARCGSLDDARKVFDSLAKRNVVTWTVMLAGYADNGLGQEALNLYARMQQEGVTPADRVTFLCLLKACSSGGALLQGKQLHSQIRDQGLETDVVVCNRLIDMYAKCGSLEDAQEVFDKLATRDVVTWTAMLAGYAQHGLGQRAVQCFEDMKLEGVEPNGVTFLSLFIACSHAGLVDEGFQYFKSMRTEYGIAPKIEHYVSIIDLFGRAGRFSKVEELLSKMPILPDLATWVTVLGACRKHGNVVLGERAFAGALRLEPKHAAAYMLMSHIYADAGLEEEAKKVEALRKKEGACKEDGRSWIEHDQEAHTFYRNMETEQP